MAVATLLIGGYSDSLAGCTLDFARGVFSPVRTVASVANPSFLVHAANGTRVYAVAENRPGEVLAYAVAGGGGLVLMDRVASGGDLPCHLALSPGGDLLAVANYDGGVGVFALARDGRFAGLAAAWHYGHASGVVPERQEKSHPHHAAWSPDGGHLLISDLGGDRVSIHRRLAPTSPAFDPSPSHVQLPPGDGPRRALFAPDPACLYVLGELSSTVHRLRPASAGYALASSHRALPSGFVGASTAAELVLHPSGRMLYASNRGHDSIACFPRDPQNGTLSPAAHLAAPRTPRHFAVSPDGALLLVAGQDADLVEAHRLDPATGELVGGAACARLATARPACVLFV